MATSSKHVAFAIHEFDGGKCEGFADCVSVLVSYKMLE
jgi:hypothetical protein